MAPIMALLARSNVKATATLRSTRRVWRPIQVEWDFTPSTAGLRAGVGDSIQDTTYLYFGIWDQEPLLASDTTCRLTADFKYMACSGGGGGADRNMITARVSQRFRQ